MQVRPKRIAGIERGFAGVAFGFGAGPSKELRLVGLAFALAACGGSGDAGGSGACEGKNPDEMLTELGECGLADPCGLVVPGVPGFDYPEDPFSGYDQDDICLLTAMRDRAPVHLRVQTHHDENEWANGYDVYDVFVWGAQASVVITNTYNGATEPGIACGQDYDLEPSDYFQTCLDAADLGEQQACLEVDHWITSSGAADGTCG